MMREQQENAKLAETREMNLQEKLVDALDRVQSLEDSLEKEKLAVTRNNTEIERMSEALKEVRKK
jgi:hypothetical protein